MERQVQQAQPAAYPLQEGGVVAAACSRTGFPTEIDQLLLRLTGSHAATAFPRACLFHECTRSEDELRKALHGLDVKVVERTAKAMQESLAHTSALTHIGIGQAKVEKVASNRRILGVDDKVRWTRTSATSDPRIRSEPEGLIDPWLKTVSFWSGERLLAVHRHGDLVAFPLQRGREDLSQALFVIDDEDAVRHVWERVPCLCRPLQ